MAATIINSLQLLAIIVAPFVLFTLIIHQLEKFTQFRLAQRFGWKSILWTGWLGTPIHELSHVAMCIVFRHRIDDVALFEPDVESGRLGYVRHSFTQANWFERVGNVFIGLAPLAGGALALAALLMIFYPTAVENSIANHQANSLQSPGPNQNYGQTSNPTPNSNFDSSFNRTPGSLEQHAGHPYDQQRLGQPFANSPQTNSQPNMAASIANFFDATSAATSSLFRQIFNLENFQTKRFWCFLYLTLCVSSHMAPSRSDYRGAMHGAWLLGGFVLGLVLLASVLELDAVSTSIAVMKFFTPVLAIMILAVILCTIAAAMVFLITMLFPIRYELR